MKESITVRKFAPEVYMGYCPKTQMFGICGKTVEEAKDNVLDSVRRYLRENAKWILTRVFDRYNEKYTEGFLKKRDHFVFPRLQLLQNPKGQYAIFFTKLYLDDSWPIKFKTEIAANMCVQDYLDCFLAIDNHLISNDDLIVYYEKIKDRIQLLKNQ